MFPLPAPPRWKPVDGVDITLRRLDDAVVFYRSGIRRFDESLRRLRPSLGIGRYELRALQTDGLLYVGGFTIADLEPSAEPLEVELRLSARQGDHR